MYVRKNDWLRVKYLRFRLLSIPARRTEEQAQQELFQFRKRESDQKSDLRWILNTLGLSINKKFSPNLTFPVLQCYLKAI